MITVDTPRKHVVNIANYDITIYHSTPEEIKSGEALYSHLYTLKGVYAEFDRARLERIYGYGTDYKGLLVIDGLFPYLSSSLGAIPEGYFTIAVGDKVLNYLTEEAYSAGIESYVVKDVAEHLKEGLLTVEVTLG